MNDFFTEQVGQLGNDGGYFHIVRQTEGYFTVLDWFCFVKNNLFGLNGLFGALTSWGSLGKVGKRVLTSCLFEFLFCCWKG